MNELDEISMKIESLRQKMYKTIEEEKDIQSCRVIIISQRLDKLLVEYDRLKSEINL